MKPIADWRRVLTRAWSVRLMVVAALLSGLEVAVPLLDGLLPVPQGVFAGLASLSTIAATVARFVLQRSLTPSNNEPDWENGDPK